MPMAELVAAALVAGGCEPVVLVGGDTELLARFGHPVVADRFPGQGPAGGVLSALDAVPPGIVVVAACDVPMLDGEAVAAVARAVADGACGAAVAVTDRWQPSLTAWRTSARDDLVRAWTGGARALHELIAAVPHDEVAVDPEVLRNVNTPRRAVGRRGCQSVAWRRGCPRDRRRPTGRAARVRWAAGRRRPRARRVRRGPRARGRARAARHRAGARRRDSIGDGPTYVICRSGARSCRACEFLAEQGIDGVEPSTSPGGRWPGSRPAARSSAGTSPRDGALDRPTGRVSRRSSTRWSSSRATRSTPSSTARRTYYPRLALVQIAWPGGLVLIDPLAVDPLAFARLFDSPALAVAHAAQQDLDVLTHAVGAIPRHLFDTQVAAGFVGYGTPSLVSLLQGELGITPAKGDRLTDWLRRPLTEDQRELRRGRRGVAARAARPARRPARGAWAAWRGPRTRARSCAPGRPAPSTPRTRGPSSRTSARCARRPGPSPRPSPPGASARRRRTTSPVRQVLPDLAILGIAQRQPTTVDELAQARGVDERHRRGRIGREIVAAVEPRQGGRAAARARRGRRARPRRSARRSRWCRRGSARSPGTQRIDTALLATRADLVALIRGDPDARLGPRLARRAGRRRHRPPDGRPRRPHVRRQGRPQADRRLTTPSARPWCRHLLGRVRPAGRAVVDTEPGSRPTSARRERRLSCAGPCGASSTAGRRRR